MRRYSHRDRSTPRGLAFALQKLRNAKRRIRSSSGGDIAMPELHGGKFLEAVLPCNAPFTKVMNGGVPSRTPPYF
jgi:hypothetical protein